MGHSLGSTYAAKVKEDEPPQFAIPAAMDRVFREINTLESKVEMLQARLTPVLSQQRPDDGSQSGREVSMTPLANDIESQADRLMSLNLHLTDLLDRLQV